MTAVIALFACLPSAEQKLLLVNVPQFPLEFLNFGGIKNQK